MGEMLKYSYYDVRNIRRKERLIGKGFFARANEINYSGPRFAVMNYDSETRPPKDISRYRGACKKLNTKDSWNHCRWAIKRLHLNRLASFIKINGESILILLRSRIHVQRIRGH